MIVTGTWTTPLGVRPAAIGGQVLTVAYHELRNRDTSWDVKTLRLDPTLETRLQRAAAASGESLSEFIRRAAAQRADKVLNPDNRDDFADVLGVIHGGGGRARRTGSAFTEALVDAPRKP